MIIIRRKEHFIASKGWFHCFRSLHEFINLKLSVETANSGKDATMKFASKFQELQVILALHRSATLLCKSNAGFGWNVKGILEDIDDHGKLALPPFK